MKALIIGGPGFMERHKKESEAPEGSDEEESTESKDEEDAEDAPMNDAVKALFAAMKSGDVKAGAKALQAALSCSDE